MDASTHRAISRGSTTFAIRGIQPASIQALPSDAHLDSGVKVPMPIQAPLFCRARPYAASRATSLDVSWTILEAPDRPVDRRSSGRPAACRRQKPILTIGRYVI